LSKDGLRRLKNPVDVPVSRVMTRTRETGAAGIAGDNAVPPMGNYLREWGPGCGSRVDKNSGSGHPRFATNTAVTGIFGKSYSWCPADPGPRLYWWPDERGGGFFALDAGGLVCKREGVLFRAGPPGVGRILGWDIRSFPDVGVFSGDLANITNECDGRFGGG